MAYVSLYRRYRPASFAEVVGQQHVVQTLVHALQEDRLAHAYLFAGPRGTGKTSIARILAKTLNCERGPTPEPCGECEQCRSIGEGTSIDVIELDMASHGGVDDARELRERALFAPASARRKVYILDEVHMASTAAFNALLKLIEEPPPHVLFAMATTDPQKVLPTILSRVQRLDLRRVAAGEVAAHVRRICAAEGYEMDDGAVDAVVRAGDGSVRDTLSVLEQVLAFAGEHVSTAAVEQTLGVSAVEQVVEVVDLLAVGDLAGLFAVVQRLVDQGTDLRRFTLDLVGHLRDLLVLQVAPDRPDLVDATDERRARLLVQAPLLPRDSMLRAVDVLAATVAEQRQGSPRLPLELALAQLAVPGGVGDLAALHDRIARVEAALAAGGPGAAPVRPALVAVPAAPTDTEASPPLAAVEDADPPALAEAVPVPADDAPPPPAADDLVVPAPAGDDAAAGAAPEGAVPGPASDVGVGAQGDEPADASEGEGEVEPFAMLQTSWDAVLELLKVGSRRHHAMVWPSVPLGLSRGILTLRYGARYASFHAVQARSGDVDRALREAIQEVCGLRVRIDVVVEGEDDRRRPMPPSVTPDDARTPVLDDRPVATTSASPERVDDTAANEHEGADADAEASSGDEGTDVREAELGAVEAVDDVDELLASELDAQLLEERPAPGASEG